MSPPSQRFLAADADEHSLSYSKAPRGEMYLCESRRGVKEGRGRVVCVPPWLRTHGFIFGPNVSSLSTVRAMILTGIW